MNKSNDLKLTRKARANLEWLLKLNHQMQLLAVSKTPSCSLTCCPDKHCECEDCWACD